MLIISKKVRKTLLGQRENLLVIGGGILQEQTLIQANCMCLGKIIVDGDENCYCRRSPYHNPDYFIHCSTKDINGIIKKTKQFIKKHKIKLVGVYTQGTDVEYTVAEVAKAFHLPHIPFGSAFACNNKIIMHHKFSDAGIPQALYFVADDLKEAEVKAGKMGFPCVIKPPNACASRGITIVNCAADVEKAYHLAKSYATDVDCILIEQYLRGKEYSVDTIVYQNKLYPAGISDREFLVKDDYAIQCGSLTPSLLPSDKQKEIYWLMERARAALEVDNGAFKGDAIIHNGQVKLIEVTARLSGGFDSQFRKPLSFGINLIKATMDIAMGKPLDFTDIIPQWFRYSKTFSVFPKPGVIKEIIGQGSLIDGVHRIFCDMKVGDVIGEYKHCANRVAHIIISAPTLSQLYETQQRVLDNFKIITE